MIRSTFNTWREYLTPASHTSTFNKTGQITPEEFVQAGDYLTYKFPTWQWGAIPKSRKGYRSFLPEEKQYLVTRKVPSYVRAGVYLGEDEEDEEEKEEDQDGLDGWAQTSRPGYMRNQNGNVKARVNHETVEDIDDLIDDTAEDFSGNEADEEGPLDKRSYDLFIHYSTTYRVPRMYLHGFDSNGTPLSPESMFEDISSDYRDKTVTIEKAPFMNDTVMVSIHPCKHADVMRVLIARAMVAAGNRQTKKENHSDREIMQGIKKLGLNDGPDVKVAKEDDDINALDEDWEDVKESQDVVKEVAREIQQSDVVRVDQYLVIFLKFITSVTPGIEHDYTMDAF